MARSALHPSRRPSRQRSRHRQSGVAVLTALLVTALAVTLVCDLFRQQQVLVRGMEGRQLQLQARLAMRSLLDDARMALRDDARTLGDATTLAGTWHLARTEVPIDTGAGQALSARTIEDAQARFNLRNLVKGGEANPFQVVAFARLLSTLGLEPALAKPVAAAIARGALADLDDLAAVMGIAPAQVARLREFLTLLPEATAININTAPAEVLTAVAHLSLAEAHALVAQRGRAHFRDNGDFALRLHDRETLEGVDYGTGSHYFYVAGRVHVDRVRLDALALVKRADSGASTLLWLRQDQGQLADGFGKITRLPLPAPAPAS